MPHIEVNGLQIHYREAGEGPPLVFVHGFTGNTRNWALNIPALRERYRCLSLDLPGHGLSDRPSDAAPYSFEAMAGIVVGAMQALRVESACLIGHSMGGMVSQFVALDHPWLLRALVLVDTAAEPLAMRTRDREKLVAAARNDGIEAAFELQLAASPQRNDERFVAIWREQFLMTSVDAYIHCAETMAGRSSLLPRLHEIKVPTLIVCGEHDDPFLVPSRHMNEAIPGSRLEIIAGAGHSPTFETPAVFNAVLTGFLDRVYAGAPA